MSILKCQAGELLKLCLNRNKISDIAYFKEAKLNVILISDLIMWLVPVHSWVIAMALLRWIITVRELSYKEVLNRDSAKDQHLMVTLPLRLVPPFQPLVRNDSWSALLLFSNQSGIRFLSADHISVVIVLDHSSTLHSLWFFK